MREANEPASNERPSPVSAVTLRHRRHFGAVLGGSLGAWWSLCVVGAAFAERMLWAFVPGETGQGRAVGSMAFARYAAEVGLPRAVLLSLGILLCVIVGAIAGYAVTVIGQWLRLDPEQHSRRALFDMLAQWRPALIWAVPFLIGIAITSLHDFRIGSMDASNLVAIGSFALVPLTPFLVLDRRVLEYPSPKRIWIPRWPGWRVVLAGLVIAFVAFVVGMLEDILSRAMSGAAVLGIESLGSVVDVVLATLLCIAWIDRRGFRAFAQPFLSSAARSSFLPQFALMFRSGVVALWLLPIFLVPAVLAIFVIPSIESTLAHLQLPAPPFFGFARVDYLTPALAIGCALNPIMTFATGRTYVLGTSIHPDLGRSAVGP